MSNLTVPNLTLRETNGGPLTNAQIDANWKTLRNFSNSLSALFGVSLNTDGSLKPNTVENDDIKVRQITNDRMALTAMPVFEDVGAVNSVAIAPDPAATAYENKQVFIVKIANANTGPALFKLNNLATLPIKKRGGLELESGDLSAKQVVMLVVFNDNAHLIAGEKPAAASGSGGSGAVIDDSGNLQGVIYNASAAVPSNGDSASFTHALNGLPDAYYVALECVDADSPYATGDLIPAQAISSSGAAFVEMFTIKANANYIVVTRNAAGDGYYGGDTLDLTTPKWQLRVRAVKEKSPNVNLPAPISFQVVRPEAAVTFGQYAFVYQNTMEGGSTPCRIYRVDLQTGQVEMVGTCASRANGNFSTYRSATNEDRLLFVSNGGVHWTTLQKPSGGSWVIGEAFSGSTYNTYKVLAVDAPTGTLTTGDNLFLGPQMGTGAVKSYTVKKKALGGAETSMTAIDFTQATGGDAGKFSAMLTTPTKASIIACLYNPVKKRLYVVDSCTGFLHIFTLGTDLTSWLGTGALTYASLVYTKSIAIGGSAGLWTDKANAYDSISVEFDHGTGEERAIILAQCNDGPAGDRWSQTENSLMPGAVTVIPWRE